MAPTPPHRSAPPHQKASGLGLRRALSLSLSSVSGLARPSPGGSKATGIAQVCAFAFFALFFAARQRHSAGAGDAADTKVGAVGHLSQLVPPPSFVCSAAPDDPRRGAIEVDRWLGGRGAAGPERQERVARRHRPSGAHPYEPLGESDDSSKSAIIPQVKRQLSVFLPIFYRCFGLSWETSPQMDSTPEASRHSGSGRIEFSSKSTTLLM